MSKGEKLQYKVQGLYEKISTDLYLNRDDFEANGQRYNSALLFGTLTELSKGNMLLFGEYGGGKTTSAEYLNAVFNGLPLDLVKRVAIRGNPQLTEEKMIGRPHYGKMHLGEEDVVWQHFVLVGPKIFDEFNRIPESNQAVVLNGVDRGEWNYLNDFVSTGRQPFFATCNYADRGNNGLIPPILDRFDVAVEAGFPGVMNALHIAQDYHNDKDQVLRNPELTRKALAVLKKEGLEKAEKREGRVTSQGKIFVYAHHTGKVVGLVELLCETDFVAKTEVFESVGRDLAMQVASMGEKDLGKQDFVKDGSKKVSDLVKEVIAKTGENVRIGQVFRVELGK